MDEELDIAVVSDELVQSPDWVDEGGSSGHDGQQRLFHLGPPNTLLLVMACDGPKAPLLGKKRKGEKRRKSPSSPETPANRR